MHSSSTGDRRETRRVGSLESSESRASENLDVTVRFPPLDPFHAYPLAGYRDFPSLTDVARGIAAARLFKQTASSTVFV